MQNKIEILDKRLFLPVACDQIAAVVCRLQTNCLSTVQHGAGAPLQTPRQPRAGVDFEMRACVDPSGVLAQNRLLQDVNAFDGPEPRGRVRALPNIQVGVQTNSKLMNIADPLSFAKCGQCIQLLFRNEPRGARLARRSPPPLLEAKRSAREKHIYIYCRESSSFQHMPSLALLMHSISRCCGTSFLSVEYRSPFLGLFASFTLYQRHQIKKNTQYFHVHITTSFHMPTTRQQQVCEMKEQRT